MATLRFALNRRAITPGNEISSATHFGLPYHFPKLRPTASAGVTTPSAQRTPGQDYPTSRLGPAGHSRFLATRWARDPPRAAAAGARRDARAAPGPAASGDRVRTRGLVSRRSPGGPTRPQVRPAPRRAVEAAAEAAAPQPRPPAGTASGPAR